MRRVEKDSRFGLIGQWLIGYTCNKQQYREKEMEKLDIVRVNSLRILAMMPRWKKKKQKKERRKNNKSKLTKLNGKWMRWSRIMSLIEMKVKQKY